MTEKKSHMIGLQFAETDAYSYDCDWSHVILRPTYTKTHDKI